jgi:hypothetical protein
MPLSGVRNEAYREIGFAHPYEWLKPPNLERSEPRTGPMFGARAQAAYPADAGSSASACARRSSRNIDCFFSW